MKQEKKKPRVSHIPSNHFYLQEWQTLDKEGFYELVCVIEYSAYEQLKAKLEKAKEALELLSEDRHIADFQRALLSSMFLARQTLKEIEGEES